MQGVRTAGGCCMTVHFKFTPTFLIFNWMFELGHDWYWAFAFFVLDVATFIWSRRSR